MQNRGHEPGPDSLPRRSFLRLAWQGILAFGSLCGLAGLLQFLNYQPQPPAPEKTLIGTLEDFPFGSATVLPEARALVRREQTGLAVISLTCPHLGCMVEPTPEGFACPCHGSRYAQDGTLLRGPSRADLPRLALETTPEGVWVLNAD